MPEIVVPGAIIQSSEPGAIIPSLLAHLRLLSPSKANWIEDVYSEVLTGIRRGSLVDRTWADTLVDACCEELNNAAREWAGLRGYHFGERQLGEWGWWKSAGW